jgi:hypothetical protein
MNPHPPPALDPGVIFGDTRGVTPPIIRETGAPSYIVGRITLPDNEWVAIDVDRPVILYVRRPVEGTDGEAVTLWYNYGAVPVADLDLIAQCSERGGVAFLSGPGRWWVYADLAIANTATVDIIDAFSPGVQSKYLAQPGCNQVRHTNVTVTSLTVATQVAQEQRARIGLTIQNVPTNGGGGTSAVVRISIGMPTTWLSTGAAATGRGIRLSLNNSITFSGDTLSRGDVYAIAEAGGPAALEVVEYFGTPYIV